MSNKHSNILLFFRSSIFFLYSTISICLFSCIMIPSAVFPVKYRHWLLRGFLRAYIYMLKKVCGINYRVEGLENVPKNRVGIVMSKHQSTWETFFLPQIFHDPAVILKRELLWVPFFGWGLAAADPIAINRSNKKSAMQQVEEKGKRCLDEGRWILVFPEGTRSAPGVVGKYKLGGARLASATDSFVIPVAHNAGRCWPRRKFIKQPGTITVVIGPIIEAKGREPDEILNLTKSWIEGTMDRIDR